jgi:hypothetical protein
MAGRNLCFSSLINRYLCDIPLIPSLQELWISDILLRCSFLKAPYPGQPPGKVTVHPPTLPPTMLQEGSTAMSLGTDTVLVYWATILVGRGVISNVFPSPASISSIICQMSIFSCPLLRIAWSAQHSLLEGTSPSLSYHCMLFSTIVRGISFRG